MTRRDDADYIRCHDCCGQELAEHGGYCRYCDEHFCYDCWPEHQDKCELRPREDEEEPEDDPDEEADDEQLAGMSIFGLCRELVTQCEAPKGTGPCR